MMHRKAVWKPGTDEIGKAFMVIAPGPHKGALQHPHMNPQMNGSMWAYGHKTQSFIKNGGQQKCLEKALTSWSDQQAHYLLVFQKYG